MTYYTSDFKPYIQCHFLLQSIIIESGKTINL